MLIFLLTGFKLAHQKGGRMVYLWVFGSGDFFWPRLLGASLNYAFLGGGPG